MSNFQTIVLVVFGVFILGAVLLFALFRGSGSGSGSSVVIWGDISSTDFNFFMNNTSLQEQGERIEIRYEEKSKGSLGQEFTEALALGVGPDLVIITQDSFWKERLKILPIPYQNISERDFKTAFVEESELFLGAEGVYALPLSIDPMVLYYNRDLLSSAGQAQPIAYWDEIYTASSNLTKRNQAGNIVVSAIALGEARNVPNAKDILSLLFLQAGSPVTEFALDKLTSQISNNYGLPIAPVEAALDFYTQFSNPTRSYYSWNRSLIDAQTHFTSGDSAYYVGFASELNIIRNKNPNLNFAIAPIPQSRVSGRVVTFGTLRGVAISRGSRNPSAALDVAQRLTSSSNALALAEQLVLPPARRDLLSLKPTDFTFSIFYDAAIQSKAWIDPDPVETDRIFREAVESITSGRARTAQAVSQMQSEVEALIKR
jgi:ABC-type glycerol-3-phosphate transport system substrate-binding protein